LTWKDLKRFISDNNFNNEVKEEQEEIKVQSAGPFRIFKDLPFWISDIEEHKTYTIYIVIINTK
jgi:hypothetical protein